MTENLRVGTLVRRYNTPSSPMYLDSVPRPVLSGRLESRLSIVVSGLTTPSFGNLLRSLVENSTGVTLRYHRGPPCLCSTGWCGKDLRTGLLIYYNSVRQYPLKNVSDLYPVVTLIEPYKRQRESLGRE